MQEIRLTVNSRVLTYEVEVRQTLCDFLREEIGLTGTNIGCEQGVCGACTVMMDGLAVRSCLMFAVQADGSEITTVEGLNEPDGSLSPLQRRFVDERAFQCGFCAPGILMAMQELSMKASISDNDIDKYLGGHICRCTGYASLRIAIDESLAALKRTV